MNTKNNHPKLKILAFEGPDKVGKTTIINELNRRTNYEFLCIDRFIGSAWVYDILSGRRKRTNELFAAEKELFQLSTVTFVNVLLHCEETKLIERILISDEAAPDRIATIDRAIELYNEYSSYFTQLPKIEVDTTNKTAGETVSEILLKLSEL